MSAEVETNAQGQSKKPVSTTVTVNNRSVIFSQHKATGLEIKTTAVNQGVPIQSDFALFEEKGNSPLKPVGDGEEVTLHPNQKFRAVAPDDNS